MKEHISLERLLKVAIAEDLIFTLAEFKHLKKCLTCVRHWCELIEANLGQAADSE